MLRYMRNINEKVSGLERDGPFLSFGFLKGSTETFELGSFNKYRNQSSFWINNSIAVLTAGITDLD
jgi:hypothetical protein